MPKAKKKQTTKNNAPWYTMVVNQVDGSNVVNLHIYGEIGWEVTAQQFIAELEALGDVDTVEVEIGSVGGAVFEGLAIYNALLAHDAKISVMVTSLAASMASIIAQAADPGELRMMEQSMMMIHNPATGVWGDQHDLKKAAEMLEKIRDAITGAYMRRYTGTTDQLIELLDDETWLTAAEAVEIGLADATVEQELDIAASLGSMDLSMYNDTPKEFLALASGQGEDQAAQAAARAQLVGNIIARHQQSAAADNETEDQQMTPEEKAAAEKAAREAEARRQGDIRAAFSQFEFDGREALMNTCLGDVECTIDMARAKMFEAMAPAEGAEPIVVGAPIVTEDARDKFVAGAEQAIEMRVGRATADHSNEYLSMSLVEMCRRDLGLRGVSVSGMNKVQIVNAAMQPGSDFPGILENIATKEVLRGYQEKPEIYTRLARIGNLPDFKTASRTGLSAAPSLPQNRELQEVETIEISDRKQSIALATYAGKAGLTRQAIVNDDLSQFSRMFTLLGQGARRTVGDQFAAVFTGHVDGQLIDEGSARIFSSSSPDRGNTGTGGVITTTSLSELRKLMGLQSDVSGNATNLNIEPEFLLVPKALEGQALTVVRSENEVTTAKTNRTPNVERDRWEVVTDARLDSSGLAGAATRYYALANPNSTDTIELAFLDGRDEPQIERIDIFDPFGVNFIVWIDCVAQALDFRGMAVNDGA